MKFHSITIDMSSRVTTGVRRCNVELLWDKAMFGFFSFCSSFNVVAFLPIAHKSSF